MAPSATDLGNRPPAGRPAGAELAGSAFPRLEVAGADLAGADFTALGLAGADLAGADLADVDFAGLPARGPGSGVGGAAGASAGLSSDGPAARDVAGFLRLDTLFEAMRSERAAGGARFRRTGTA